MDAASTAAQASNKRARASGSQQAKNPVSGVAAAGPPEEQLAEDHESGTAPSDDPELEETDADSNVDADSDSDSNAGDDSGVETDDENGGDDSNVRKARGGRDKQHRGPGRQCGHERQPRSVR